MEQPRIIDQRLHYHISALKHWDKNEKARQITTSNWDKFVADVSRNGIEDAFKIDAEGTIYDGNGRFDVLTYLLKQGITKATNGHDLAWIPVEIRYPKTEAEKWRIALSGNTRYRTWDKENLNNFLPEFEEELDTALINIDFGDPKSIEEQIEWEDEAETPEPPKDNKEKAEIECPSCHHKFIPD